MSDYDPYGRDDRKRGGEGRGSLYPGDRSRGASRAPREYAVSESSEEDDRYTAQNPSRPRRASRYDRTLSPIPSSEASMQAQTQSYNYETVSGEQSARRVRPQSTLRRGSSTTEPRANQPGTAQSTTSAAQTTITVRPVCAQFLDIGLNDFETCAEFVKKNSSILGEDPSKIITIAAEAYSRGQDEWAGQCLQRALIIQFCKNIPTEDLYRFISGLDNPRHAHYRTFVDTYNQQKAYCQRQQQIPSAAATGAVKQSRRQSVVPPTASKSYGSSQLQDSELAARMSQSQLHESQFANQSYSDYAHYQEQQAERAQTAQSRRRDSQAQRGDQHAAYVQPGDRGLSGVKVASGAKGKGTVESTSTTGHGVQSIYTQTSLRKNYEVKNSAFFQPGKVFRVLWHQPAGYNRDGSINQAETTSGKFGQPIYSQLRWMMVVKTRPGYSICCPISTYGGYGLARKEFKQSEVNAHAIIFAEGSNPAALRSEPIMQLRPIPIRPSADGPKIDPVSRIHLGKLHTVEHNVKVADVGSVPSDHVGRVLQYVRQLFEA